MITPLPHIRIEGFKGAALTCEVMAKSPFFLHGPVNAGHIMGAQWFASLLAELKADYPQARISAVLDCRNHTGQALIALECGIAHVLVGDVPQTAYASLQQIAQQGNSHIWRDIGAFPAPAPASAPQTGVLPAPNLFALNDHYLPLAECKKRLLAHLASQ